MQLESLRKSKILKQNEWLEPTSEI